MDKNRETITEICKFLDIEIPPEKEIQKYMKPSRAKQNQNNLYAKVPNYEEIRQRFPKAFD